MKDITCDKRIYTTTNYSRFKRLMNNRDIKDCGIKNIIDSINTVGYITNPIIVNEKYEVIDGQHRLEAFKALVMPVDYIMVKGAGIEECRLMNRKQGNWSTMDYLKSYARSGNENYMRLYDLMLRHPSQKLAVITFAITEAKQSNANICEGTFICSKEQYEIADNRLIFADSVFDAIKSLDGRTDYMLMASIYAHENETVDQFRLIDTLTKNIAKVRPAVTFTDALDSISEAYNYRARNKIFLKTDWLRENQSYARNREKHKKHSHKYNTGEYAGEIAERTSFNE